MQNINCDLGLNEVRPTNGPIRNTVVSQFEVNAQLRAYQSDPKIEGYKNELYRLLEKAKPTAVFSIKSRCFLPQEDNLTRERYDKLSCDLEDYQRAKYPHLFFR